MIKVPKRPLRAGDLDRLWAAADRADRGSGRHWGKRPARLPVAPGRGGFGITRIPRPSRRGNRAKGLARIHRLVH
jgi:hypothetical protein